MAAYAAFAAERRRIDDRDLAHARPPRGCVRPRSSRVMASVEEVTMFFDMSGKVQRVLSYQGLGALGIALFQRFDDPHVIDDRARRAVALRDRHPPYRSDMDEKVLDRLAHQMRAG